MIVVTTLSMFSMMVISLIILVTIQITITKIIIVPLITWHVFNRELYLFKLAFKWLNLSLLVSTKWSNLHTLPLPVVSILLLVVCILLLVVVVRILILVVSILVTLYVQTNIRRFYILSCIRVLHKIQHIHVLFR